MTQTMRHFRHPPRSRRDLVCSGTLRSETWQFLTDDSV